MIEQLLGDVIAHPDDDAPRLAFAAALDPVDEPRRRFIQLQIAAAAAQRAGAARLMLRPTERDADELLAAHGQAWHRMLCPPCETIRYLRGFVEHIGLSMRDFLTHGAHLKAQAPVRHLDLTYSPDAAAELFASPLLAGVRSLKLDRCRLGDDDMQALAASPHLAELRWLQLMRNDIGMDGARALAASTGLSQLAYVGFFGNRVDPVETLDVGDYGSILDRWLPEEGLQLEAMFGHIRWLHFDDALSGSDVPPSRYL